MKQRVLLKGRDGLDLLHRISTTDIKHLKLKQKTGGLLLNPSGKILAVFEIELLTVDEASITFSGSFIEELDRLTFAERYTLTPQSLENDSEINERVRICSLIPSVGNEIKTDGSTNPLEVNLGTWISDQKGCYPGQEVIEKIISLGSPARKLCLLEKSNGDDPQSLPATLKDESGAIAGELTSYAEDSGLAIIKRTHLKLGIALFSDTAQFSLKQISL